VAYTRAPPPPPPASPRLVMMHAPRFAELCLGDFFPNISSLYIDNMADANANVNPPATTYAICSYLLQSLLQFLVLAFEIDVIGLSVLAVICSSILLVCMIRLIPTIIIVLYYWLFWTKSYGKLLIFSTPTSTHDIDH
jgi:hypothetical protein